MSEMNKETDVEVNKQTETKMDTTTQTETKMEVNKQTETAKRIESDDVKRIRESLFFIRDLTENYEDQLNIKSHLAICKHFLDTASITPLGLLKLRHATDRLYSMGVALSCTGVTNWSEGGGLANVIAKQVKVFKDLLAVIGNGLFVNGAAPLIPDKLQDVDDSRWFTADGRPVSTTSSRRFATAEVLDSWIDVSLMRCRYETCDKTERSLRRGATTIAFAYFESISLRRYMTAEEQQMLYANRRADCIKQVEEIKTRNAEMAERLDTWMFKEVDVKDRENIKEINAAVLEFAEAKAAEFSDLKQAELSEMKVKEFVDRFRALVHLLDEVLDKCPEEYTDLDRLLKALGKRHVNAVVLSDCRLYLNGFQLFELDVKVVFKKLGCTIKDKIEEFFD